MRSWSQERLLISYYACMIDCIKFCSRSGPAVCICVVQAPAPQYQLQPNDTLDSVAAKFYSYPICILYNNRSK